MPTLPMFPLEVAMLPGEELPLRIFEPRYSALVQTCLAADDPVFGVVLIEAGREVGGGDSRSDVGALARIAEYADLGAGAYRLNCVIGERFRVLEWQPDNPYPQAAVELWPDEPGAPVDVGALARIAEYADLGAGAYRLNCVIGERFRVVEWQQDNPYPQAVVELWPDEAGAPVDVDAIRDIEDRIVALFERIAAVRGAEVNGRDIVRGADESGDAAMWLYTLATRLPIGQADKYAVLAASTAVERVAALSEAVETVIAMVEFQLSEG